MPYGDMGLGQHWLRLPVMATWMWVNIGSGYLIWHHGYGSTLAQVMAWCLSAPNHYLNQCWLTIKGVRWHIPESNFTACALGTILCMMSLEIILLKFLSHLSGALFIVWPCGTCWWLGKLMQSCSIFNALLQDLTSHWGLDISKNFHSL